MNLQAAQFGSLTGITPPPLPTKFSPRAMMLAKQRRDMKTTEERIMNVPENWMKCVYGILHSISLVLWDWCDSAIKTAEYEHRDLKQECRLLRRLHEQYEKGQQQYAKIMPQSEKEEVIDAIAIGWEQYTDRFTKSVRLRLSEIHIPEKDRLFYLSVVQAYLGYEISESFSDHIDNLLFWNWGIPRFSPILPSPPKDKNGKDLPFNLPTALKAMAPEKVWKATRNARKLCLHSILENVKRIHSEMIKEHCNDLKLNVKTKQPTNLPA